ncbi:hypothetical protein TRSC58_04058 [Trypanosoma rangeli SC58]|uniref:Uncharacterized protein n=1 Tax=Trypanosoma rangeli SC58 TaxID=429131 RepID=A0A061IYL2_TRYRA|nr:hypothetical protein TRSC58_04058 [Trypanosoma rangeli SC58]
MHHAAAASWNQLVPESRPLTLASCPVATVTASMPRANKTGEHEESGSETALHVAVSDWEKEAIRRYRKLQIGVATVSSQSEYLSSSANNGAFLQLILRSKLLPVKDWCECARVMGSWFHGSRSPPLGLLSYLVTHLVVAHKLTPCSAATWILDLSKVLLTEDADTIDSGGLVSVRNWGFATELERSVYVLQSTGSPLFKIFPSLVLDRLLDDVFSGRRAPESWRVLCLCFLLKRNKEFMQSAWESDEKRHCMRMQRACELGREVPPHIAAVLTAVV